MLRRLLRTLGFEIIRCKVPAVFPPDYTAEEIEIIKAAKPYTMARHERIYAIIEAVRYLVRADVPGSIVECGVWRGGAMMAATLTLLREGCIDRDLYLFDTYAGMVKPTHWDIDYTGKPASATFQKVKLSNNSSDWCFASLNEVQQNLYSTGYPKERLYFIKGKVEETIPDFAPETIAFLRLDTDWYESTRHELMYLYPRLSSGGVLIIDDYAHWQGSRRATDEYFTKEQIHILLNRIDYSARIAIKR